MKTAEEMIDEATEFGSKAQTKDNLARIMKLYANAKLDEAADKSQEMIYDRKYTQILESGSGLILRDFQMCYATPKQSILSLKDKI